MSELIDALVDLGETCTLESLPDSVVDESRRVLIDTVGVILGGASDPVVQRLALVLAAQSGSPTSTILGTGTTADAMWAALVNGTAGVWHDFDAGNRYLGGHPAVHAIPAGLALAERQGCSGRVLLEATIAGYEVAARVGLGARLRAALHPHGSWPTVGAAVAAARVLDLDTAGLRETLNASTSLTLATSWQAAREGATVRNVYAGFGAAMGVLAADLVSMGFTGELDGVTTVFGSIAGESIDAAAAIEQLGSRWEIERGYLKHYACARYLHPALDVLHSLATDHGFEAAEVHGVAVETFAFAATFDDPEPRTSLAARFSLPFAAATLLVNGDAGVDDFGAEQLSDGAVRTLAQRVSVRSDPAMTAAGPAEAGARVTVELADGRRLSAATTVPRGETARAPMSDDDLDGKFMALARSVLPQGAAVELLRQLRRIEDVGDVRELAVYFRAVAA